MLGDSPAWCVQPCLQSKWRDAGGKDRCVPGHTQAGLSQAWAGVRAPALVPRPAVSEGFHMPGPALASPHLCPVPGPPPCTPPSPPPSPRQCKALASPLPLPSVPSSPGLGCKAPLRFPGCAPLPRSPLSPPPHCVFAQLFSCCHSQVHSHSRICILVLEFT